MSKLDHNAKHSRSGVKVPEDLSYYCLTNNWSKVKPHLKRKLVRQTLVANFHKYTFYNTGEPFRDGMYPADFDKSSWRDEAKGSKPPFWRYACLGTCHFLVNFTLVLAKSVEPTREWRIVTSPGHSTVWDGEKLLFDINFQALGISAYEALTIAAMGKSLQPGIHFAVRTYDPELAYSNYKDRLDAMEGQ